MDSYEDLPDYLDSDEEGDLDSPSEKEKIPRAIKLEVWFNYAQNRREVDCWVNCGTKITIHSFHAGHVLAEAEGGQVRPINLRPICGRCNSSIGKRHMHDFVVNHGLLTIPGYCPMKRRLYKKANHVPEVVKRRVWHDISNKVDPRTGKRSNSIFTTCTVKDCPNQVSLLRAKYGFYTIFGEGTVQNIKPICDLCYKQMGASTICFFEEFYWDTRGKRARPPEKMKPRKKQKIQK